MKKILMVITGLIITFNATSQTWSWSAALGGRSNTDGSIGMDRDATGNIYVCGDFEGTRNFGGTSLTAVAFSDFYFSKYNSTGTHQWTIQLSGTGTTTIIANGVAVDPSGNILVTGYFSYNVTIGGTTYINPGGNGDSFIAKYSPTGTLIWSKVLSGNGNEFITSIKTLGTDIYISGGYSQALTFGTISLAAPAGGFDDAFVMKLDAQGDGVWGVKGGGNNDDRALCLSVSNNSIYWAGFCNSVASFGGVNLNPLGTLADIFICKLDGNGTQSWVKRYGGNFGQQINGMSQDPWGNPICTGNFYGTCSFGAGFSITENYAMFPAGNGDGFVTKLNAVDGTCSWVRQIKCINGDNNEVSNGAVTDPGGSTYVTGHFNATTVFASSSNQTGPSLVSTNGKDAFIAKYSQTGTLLWVQKIGGSSNDQGKAVVYDANGICTVAGNFGGTLTLGTTAPITASPGAASVFIAKYDGLSAGVDEPVNTLKFEAHPNPADHFITVTSELTEPIELIEIYTVTGVRVLETKLDVHTNNYQIDLSELSSGMYFLQITAGENKGVKKIQIK
ncbi:MAG: T9SS type A sorting domain-containing protein [Bacteroidetes bacterium]|nr:T9SS type A sorting domain-containing protein [Bacteroidota bacterium]